jgi:hypothetical protein
MNLRRKAMLGMLIIVLVLTLAGVFSFSRLPNIVPDLTRRAGPAVALVGQSGPLSAAQS